MHQNSRPGRECAGETHLTKDQRDRLQFAATGGDAAKTMTTLDDKLGGVTSSFNRRLRCFGSAAIAAMLALASPARSDRNAICRGWKRSPAKSSRRFANAGTRTRRPRLAKC